jgi:transposase-like protein
VRRTVPPSAEIEEQIDRLLAVGVGENPREALSVLAKLGARLIIQRAVEDEFDAWLGRARYERRAEAPPGLRNGFRARRVQTAEGELEVEIPQVREAAEPFVSKLFPRGTKLLRTEPLKAMVIGAFVRGLSMRDVESLCEQAGLGKLSKSTASRICSELRERFERSGAAISTTSTWPRCSWTRSFSPSVATGPRRRLVAWGFTEAASASFGGDARDARVPRGLAGARARPDRPRARRADADRRRRRPGLIKAIEQCWPASDRQHCAVHRVRNLLAKLPERERERIRGAYWQALDEATNERDAKQRLLALVGELDKAGYTAAAKCLADDLDALVVHLRYPTRHRRRWRSTNLLERSLGEVKRRTKVIGRFPGETSCLTLVWAVLDLYISHATNGIKFTQLERQQLKRTRSEGNEPTTAEEVSAA